MSVGRDSHQIASWLLAGGLLLTGIGGAFAPWIWRESVALQLTGPGLAEFVKFLAEIRAGQIQVGRLYFLYPLFLTMLALPILIENKALSLPRWIRWGLRLSVIPFALAALSPVWTPAILIDPEFRTQTLLAVTAMGLTVIAPIFGKLPLTIGVMGLIIGGLAALILPLQQFSLIQAPITAAYNSPVWLGWGWQLTVSGLLLSMAGGAWAAFWKKSKA